MKITGEEAFYEFFDSMFLPEDCVVAVQAGANTAIASMARRVQDRGEGLDDKRMTWKGRVYSEGWEKVRKYGSKKLEITSGKQVNHKDLLITGALWIAIHVEYTRPLTGKAGAESLVAVGSEQADKAIGNQRYTPWFGMSPKDSDAVRETIAAIMEQLLGKKK